VCRFTPVRISDRTLIQDSTVLAHVMSVLNKRYDYGLDLYLLSIDEGITGYRDDSLEVRFSFSYRLPRLELMYRL
jgi:cytoplasmic tRNA 2-thiolation protein 1